MPVPYTFGTATSSIPLSQLDSNFATAITIGNTAVQLGNTVTTLNNLTLANVTISSGNVTITNVSVTTANATTANVGTLVVTANATVAGNVAVTGNVTMNVATITTSNVTTENVSSLIVSGNQTFVGTGNRITGDFSNATIANRVMFQSSTTNGNTILNLIPNGTGTTCAFGMDTDPTLTNSSTGSLNLVASTDVRLSAGIRGTGTYLPMTFYTGGSEKMRIDTSGNVGIGTSSPGVKLDVINGAARVKAAAGNDGLLYIDNSGAAQASIVNFGTNGTLGAMQIVYGGSSYGVLGGANSLNFYNTTAGPTVFYSSSTERMRIDSSGNVLVTGAGGLGYGTGSGGAVTQATSRTTGVTLNKTNGAITLVSAAGSATYQTFTVTNSTVAATDTIIVNQKSGTDKNIILVTNVAAGSFAITFATTGGTTTEQPVFNFAVIKAVAA